MTETRFTVTVNFDLVIPNDQADEIEFLSQDESEDRDLAVWDYLTNWVNGKQDAPRPRSCVEYHGMSVCLD